MKKFIALMLTLMLAFAFIGCGEKTIDVTGLKINFSGDEKALEIGQSLSMSVVITPADASNLEVNWETNAPKVATVEVKNGKAVVTGIAEGSAVITVSSKAIPSIKASVTVTVIAKQEEVKVNPTALSFKVSEFEIKPEDSVNLELQFEPATTTEKDVTWTTSDAAVATVVGGKVTAVAEGTATITATSKTVSTLSATATITVSNDIVDEVLVSEISIRAEETEYYTNYVQTLKATTNEDATNNTVTWSSSDETVATVDATTGKVTPVAAGTVTITATANDNSGVTAEVTLTIKAMVTPETYELISNVDATRGLKFNTDTTLVVKVTPEENGDPTSTFVSSDESIATVDPNTGVVHGVAIGEVTITATSVLDPTKSDSVTIKVTDGSYSTTPESIHVTGEESMYIGEAFSIRLSATVIPSTASQNVVWSSQKPDIASVDQNGNVVGLSEGTARIKCTSEDGSIYEWHLISVEVYVAPPVVDLQGYEIVIMNADSALTDIDPFLEGYTQIDQAAKQTAWRAVEETYNCTITVKGYPTEAPWGQVRIDWINNNATNQKSQCDLGIVSSNWIYKFATKGGAADVTALYGKYGRSSMEPAVKACGSYGGKLYTATTGISPTATYIDLGVYYNMAWVEKLGVDDPATMFNNGNWTYSNFVTWVKTVQAGLGEAEFALDGHPYYWWLGMTNAAGQKVADDVTVQVNISTDKSKAASAMFYSLVEAGCVETTADWSEGSATSAFMQGKAVMTTGCLWFVRNSSRWTDKMFGDDTRYGYVPFPYPDDMKKEDTRLSQSGLSVYLFIAGRPYPTGVTLAGVYQAVTDMFLQTIDIQKNDSLFDPQLERENSLSKRIDNPASIEAMVFYDASRVFFDPAHAIYSSTSGTSLRQPTIDVLFNGADYDEIFDAVLGTYDTEFKAVYSA